MANIKEAPTHRKPAPQAGFALYYPVQVHELVRQSGLPAAQVATVLLDLELEGALARHAGGRRWGEGTLSGPCNLRTHIQ